MQAEEGPMLSERERRSLHDIEQAERARDPGFTRQFDERRHWWNSWVDALRTAVRGARPWVGPVLLVVAAPVTIALMLVSVWLAAVGIALAVAGLALSVGPAHRLLVRGSAALASRRRPRSS